ncbi:PaaI family thioesterase [Bacteroidota bacterium]
MRKLNNPYSKYSNHYCFACSHSNLSGLKLDFYEEGEEIVSFWFPEKQFQGYHNILHGGIQATLIDEIASWVVQIKAKTAGVTASLQVNYRKPVYMDKDTVTVRATLKSHNKKIAVVSVRLFDSEEVLCTEGEVKYFLFSENLAKEKLLYPGFKAFYKE